MRFSLLGLLGKTVAVIALLYGCGWVAGTLGWHGAAQDLGSVALYILGLLLTVLVIRWIWSQTGQRGQ